MEIKSEIPWKKNHPKGNREEDFFAFDLRWNKAVLDVLMLVVGVMLGWEEGGWKDDDVVVDIFLKRGKSFQQFLKLWGFDTNSRIMKFDFCRWKKKKKKKKRDS